MVLTGEVVQVQLVSNPWVSIVLPATALLVSVGTLIWTIWIRQRDGARLVVKAVWAMPLGSRDHGRELISIEAVNIGRSGVTVVNSLRIGVGKTGTHLDVMDATGATFPFRLGPGESVDVMFDPVGIGAICAQRRIDPAALRPVAATGHEIGRAHV